MHTYVYVYFGLTMAMGRLFHNLTAVIDIKSTLISSHKTFMPSFCSLTPVLTLFCSSSLSLEAKYCRKCRQAPVFKMEYSV